MSDYKVTDTELTSIANAIRAKTGKSAQIEFPTEFVSEIGSISGGGGSGEQVVELTPASGITPTFITAIRAGNYLKINGRFSFTAYKEIGSVIFTLPNDCIPIGPQFVYVGRNNSAYLGKVSTNGEIVLATNYNSGSYTYMDTVIELSHGATYQDVTVGSNFTVLEGPFCKLDNGILNISVLGKFDSPGDWKRALSLPNVPYASLTEIGIIAREYGGGNCGNVFDASINQGENQIAVIEVYANKTNPILIRAEIKIN